MKSRFNYILFFTISTLVSFSFLFFACLSASASLQRFGNTHYYLFHQIYSGLIPGLIAGFIAYKISLPWLKKWSLIIFLANVVVAFMVFLPGIGLKIYGASRWINLFGFSFQPSEFLKISAILYLSAWIASRLSEENVSGWKDITKKGTKNVVYIFAPFLVFLGIIALVMYCQSDISTLGIIAATLLVIYFSAKTPLWHMVFLFLSGITTLFILIRFEPYRFERLLTFLNPYNDPLGKGLQLRQSLISLGSGGIFGKGLGMSSQKFGFLPETMSDSIFAIIGEEMGIIGCLIIVAAFVFLFWIGLQIFKNTHDKFCRLTAIGIVFWITFQAFINISSATGIFPLAGIPLPFFSYGGTHMIAEFIGIGLLLNISKNS